MNKEKWEKFFSFSPLAVYVLFLLGEVLTGFSGEFALFGLGVVLGASIYSLLGVISCNSDEPEKAASEDIRALREAASNVREKTDVIYGNLEKLCPTIARIDERTQKINEIAINIRTLRELCRESPARESTDILTNYINASLEEYARLRTEREESECNVAYLSQENARLSSRIQTLEQQLKLDE